jgi:hypothetical protein|eukprot:COSAG06_NODE_40930_length_397_cov_0.516779_1_plen_62_part_00
MLLYSTARDVARLGFVHPDRVHLPDIERQQRRPRPRRSGRHRRSALDEDFHAQRIISRVHP